MTAPTPTAWPSGPNAAAHDRLRGKVERCDGSLLAGWLLDPADPDGAVAFDLFVNDIPAGRHRADLTRGDLTQKRIGSGRHGFRVALPPGLVIAGTNAFRLEVGPGPIVVEARFDIAAPNPPAPGPAPATAAARPAAPSAAPTPAAAAPPEPLLGPEPIARPVVFGVPAPGGAQAGGTAALVAELIGRVGPAGVAGLREVVAARSAERDWPAVLLLTEAGAGLDDAILLLRARALVALGDATRAEALLRDLAARAPGDSETLSELAAALDRQQRFAESYEVLLRCRAAEPRNARHALQAARAAAQAANGGQGVAPERPDLLPEALALSREAMALMPKDGRPCRELARLLHQAGDHEGALAAMEEAERRQPQIPAFPLERARILVRLDRIEEALVAAARAAELDPANDTALFLRRVLERWGAARRTGPWRVAALSALPEDPPAAAAAPGGAA
jgi:Flp pilus assembly protein TadD